MEVYYNEFDKKKCAMLSQLMKDGHITKGYIDDRPIQDVQADELAAYTRCHFFSGIGLWDHALNLAGWPEDKPVWTGSCPCQPFSPAGRQKGKADDRHLWPEWLRLICERRPATVFGEQVASAVTHGWLDDVYQGLESEGYAVGAAVLPASSVGAPHRRERLWFVVKQASGQPSNVVNTQHDGPSAPAQPRGYGQAICHNEEGADSAVKFKGASQPSNVANANGSGPQGHRGLEQEPIQKGRQGAQRHPWQSGIWVDCPDGKQRLVEPSIQLLVNGYPARVAILHAAGDAIVPQVASGFIIAASKT